MNFKIIKLCKDEAVSIVPKSVVRFDLEKAARILKDNGFDVEDRGVMIIASKGGFEFTLYKSGRLLLNPRAEKPQVQAMVSDFYDSVEDAMERSGESH